MNDEQLKGTRMKGGLSALPTPSPSRIARHARGNHTPLGSALPTELAEAKAKFPGSFLFFDLTSNFNTRKTTQTTWPVLFSR